MKVILRLVALVLVAVVASNVQAQSFEDLLNPPPGEWPTFGGTLDSQRFSPLDQINRDNVDQLRMIWARDLDFEGQMQGGPVVWGGILYQSTADGVVALDATNGDLLWSYFEPLPEVMEGRVGNRLAPRAGPVVFEGTVYITRRDPTIVALDALTGEVQWETAVGDPALAEGFTTGPMFADGKIMVGPTGADFGGQPGRILSLNAEDGELLWEFDIVPMSPDDPAYVTWSTPPSGADGIGGASAWNYGAYDEATRTVIYGTGQPNPWDRLDWRRGDPEGEVSADLYSASFVALDVDTGEIKWYHQVVPGDEWDYDQHTVPIVADLEFEGEQRRVAILATTTGFVVLIDVATGEFLTAHQIHAENTVHLGYEADGTPIINPEARFTEPDVAFRTCPGLRWAHIAPGAFSPQTGLLYRPNNNICSQYGAQSVPDDWEPGQAAAFRASFPREPGDYFERYGALSAIDPVSGEVVWEFGTGYPHNAGALATAGGLVFSAFADRVFRAFDAETGEVLWQQILTAHSDGSAVTYTVDGVQYVAVIVGRHSGVEGIPDLNLPESVPGNPAIFAFRLP